jgi:hypothetical protein
MCHCGANRGKKSTVNRTIATTITTSTSFTRFGANAEDVNQKLKLRLAFY